MTSLTRVKNLLSKRRARIPLLLAVWGLVFFGGSVPTWRAAYRNEDKIQAASQKVSSLNKMSVAGVWFGAALDRWEPVLREEYNRLFPVEKQREQLFLEIAQVANGCGIDPFVLREVPIADVLDPDALTEDPDLAVPSSDEIDVLVEQFAMEISDLPSADIHTFRLLANFNTDYKHVIQFMKGLRSIPRALTIHSLDAEPCTEGLCVALELDFYAQSRD